MMPFSTSLLALLLTQVHAGDPSSTAGRSHPAEPVATSPAQEIALANRKLVEHNPALLSGPPLEFSDEAKAAGEHGKVIITAIIGLDGAMSEARVSTSSKSQRLDAAALAAAEASRYKPAADADGKPIAILVDMPIMFEVARATTKDSGVLNYRCVQFVRDQTWWKANWGEEKGDYFYDFALGVAMMADGPASFPSSASQLTARIRAFDVKWDKAIQDCVANPDGFAVDHLGEEGKMMRRLGEGKMLRPLTQAPR